MLTRKDKKGKDAKVVVTALSICFVLLVATVLAARGGRSGSRGGGSKSGGSFRSGSGGGGQRSGAKSSQVARPARSGGSQTRIANPARSGSGRANVGAARRSGRVQQAPSHSRPSHRRPSKGKVTNRSTIWAQMAQKGRRFSVTQGNPGAFSAFEKDEPRRRKRPRRRDRPHYAGNNSSGTGRGTGKIERRADRGAAERQVTNRSGTAVKEAGSKRGGGLKFTRRHGTSSGAKPKNRAVVKFKSNGSRKDSLLRRESILRNDAGRRGHGPGNRKREYHKGGRGHRFSGRHWRRHKRVIWPRRRHIVHYRHGHRSVFRHVYPRHHRKYIFVSLGGYWPLHYGHRRYYWYGWHPYYWYGYYPAAYEVAGNTYNYYTYNYDGETIDGQTGALTSVDADTFADVREKFAKEAAKEPEVETEADRLFDEGVKAFEAGDYDKAADKFADAGRLDPDDMILPFAHVQALFADEEYTKAAKELRQALAQLPQDGQEVFFPRGLYPDQEILLEQIDTLAAKARSYSFGGDLELLLGYQLLGTGKLDEAQELLVQIESGSKNAAAAETLLALAERIRTPAENAEEDSTQTDRP